jgi:sugar lactone lactonase YvrE
MSSPAEAATTTLVAGLGFPECPRWRDGRLYFSDFHHRRVRSVTVEGHVEVVLEHSDVLAGLGWQPDGQLLVVSMIERALLRHGDAGLEMVADLKPWTVMGANDMAVDSLGRAYIGNFGYDHRSGESPRPTVLLCAWPDGVVGPACEPVLICPNGIVVDERRQRLIVAETFAHRLSVFDLGGDGSLSNRRVCATFNDDISPDGICLDNEGQVWVATATSSEVLRVDDSGAVTARVELSSGLASYAVALGGDDGRTMFVCSAPVERLIGPLEGRIVVARVDVPAAS